MQLANAGAVEPGEFACESERRGAPTESWAQSNRAGGVVSSLLLDAVNKKTGSPCLSTRETGPFINSRPSENSFELPPDLT